MDHVQWNLHSTDTIGTLPNCPYYRGWFKACIASQATPLNQHLPASLKLAQRRLKGGLTEREIFNIWCFDIVSQLPYSRKFLMAPIFALFTDDHLTVKTKSTK